MTRSRWWIHGALFACALAAAGTARGDRVVLHNGRSLEGEVISVDGEAVVLDREDGRARIPRAEVASIHFDRSEAKPLKVELRVAAADDAMDVLLDGEEIAHAVRGGSWVDLTPRLKGGNHSLRFRIRNDRGGWAYRVSLRINGRVHLLECGKPGDPHRPCRCCGKKGDETGVLDDLPLVWIHVDPELGRAEILP